MRYAPAQADGIENVASTLKRQLGLIVRTDIPKNAMSTSAIPVQQAVPLERSYKQLHSEIRAVRGKPTPALALNGHSSHNPTNSLEKHSLEKPRRRYKRPKPPVAPAVVKQPEPFGPSQMRETTRAPPLPPRPTAAPLPVQKRQQMHSAKANQAVSRKVPAEIMGPERHSKPVQGHASEQSDLSRRHQDTFKGHLEAKYNFTKRTSIELSFSRGDRFRVLKPSEYGRRTEQENFLILEHMETRQIGYVPLNYVAPLVSQHREQPQRKPPIKEMKAPQAHEQSHDKPAPTLRQASFHSFKDQAIYTSAIARHNGYATDVVVIRGSNGQLSATDFNVRFTGSSKRAAHIGSGVDIKIDGNTCLSMLMGEGGMCHFSNKSLQCSDKELSSLGSLKNAEGRHELIYEHKFSKDGEFCVNYVRAFIWIWEYSDSVLVSDVDGTITISDVGGMLNSTLLSKVGFKKGYAHDGVCSLFHEVKKTTNCHVLYLTARPMNLIKETREYIYGLEQNVIRGRKKRGLPVGPVITDTTDLFGSLHKEVISKSSHVFKTRMLLQLRACFLRGGRDVLRFPVYVASFGNKKTDVIAYEAAGAPRLTMFLIDTYSTIQIMDGSLGMKLNSYSDPRLLSLISDRVSLIMQGKLPSPP